MSYDDEHLPEPYEVDIGGGKSTFRYARIDVTEAGLVVFEGHRRGVDVFINADGYREAARLSLEWAREFYSALGDVITFAETVAAEYAEELLGDEQPVCLTHRKFVPCRCDDQWCVITPDKAAVRAVRAYHAGEWE